MRTNQLGQSELRVSEICLGTMTFGQQNSERDAHEQLDYALDHGVNFIDTAEMYPVPAQAETQGRTEEFVGSWLARRARDQVIVATKIAGPGRPISWVRGGSLAVNRANVRAAVDASLRRLKTDYIDLYQIHWPDRYVPQFGETAYDPSKERSGTPTAEQLAALDDVVRQGKVRYVGVSNETAWGVSEFSRIARESGLPKIVTIQNAYSLINRRFDAELAEASRREDVGLLAYSPLAFGLLTGKYLAGPPPGARLSLFEGFGARYRKPNVDEAVAVYAKVARDHGVSLAQLALAFVRSRWFVKSTIIGATSLAQLEDNLASANVQLDSGTLAALEGVHSRFPNPAP
jgi:aryl-alcohol dehydrogenase-like predicted oxidoreductase